MVDVQVYKLHDMNRTTGDSTGRCTPQEMRYEAVLR